MKPFNINHIAEIKLTYQTKVAAKDRPRILNSNEAYQVLLKSWDQSTIELQEQFVLLILNRGHRLLGRIPVSIGGTHGTVVDTKFIALAIAKTNASALMIAHNHPSGNLKPSQQDVHLTKRIKDICALFEVALLDHIILTPYDGYYSFADEGLL